MVALITTAALAAGAPPSLLLSVCFVETQHRNLVHQDDGGTPSLGVCQVKEATAKLFNKRATASDLMRPEKNVRYAALYLARQIRRYQKWECAAAAYNKGSLVDTKPKTCDTKYSTKVMKTLKEELWKTQTKSANSARYQNAYPLTVRR